MYRVGVVSLGCSKNRVDSESMMGILTKAGFSITNDPRQADILIVNTCGFIEPAKEESIQSILEMASHKQEGSCKCLVVTGCLSQRYRDELTLEMPEIDVLIGVSEYETLPGLLAEKGFSPNAAAPSACDHLRAGRLLSTPRHSAYLRVADGCDNRCSYCAIPAIRGPYRSEPFDRLIAEADALVAGGAKELVVIAQDTTRYGLDSEGKRLLPKLLKRLAQTGADWIRLLYAYPDEIDEALLEAMCAHEAILKYIDIPIQHVDDALLRRMNRRGTRTDLVALMRAIRSADSRFVLRTSFIVGFPGETDAQFQTLIDFVREYPFDRAGAFVYSPEEGTPAEAFSDRVAPAIAEKRRDLLMQAQQEVSRGLLAKRVGQRCRAIVEGKNSSGGYYGRSYGEAPEIDGVVWIRSERDLDIGSFADVQVEGALDYDLIATETP